MGVSFRDCGESTFTYVYYYAKNLQGDIVGLYKRNPDGAGAQVIATYDYDPWGKVTAVRDANGNLVTYPSGSNLIAFMNPLRYRGYYQDNDTGFYYLQSRYYDPELRRFINADSYSSTGQGFLGHNMFAYCNNNPSNLMDSAGNWPKLSTIFTAVAAAAFVVAAAAATVATCGAAAPLLAVVGGQISAGVVATAAGIATEALAIAGASAAAAVTTMVVEDIDVTMADVLFAPARVFVTNTYNNEIDAQINEVKTKGKENMRDTGLTGLTDEEIRKGARDKKKSGKERNRYRREEKARKERNRAKRIEVY